MKALSEIQTELLVLLEYFILPSSFRFIKKCFNLQGRASIW